QYYALRDTLERNKTDVTEEEITLINPEIKVKAYREGITPENLDDFLKDCDYVHDVMDYYHPNLKLEFHRRSREKGLIVTMAFICGTGASVLSFHPERMSFDEYFEVPKHLEGWDLNPNKIMGKSSDYIDSEYFMGRVKQGNVPTSCDGAYLTGIIAAGIYKRLLMGKEVAYVPEMIRIDVVDDLLYKKLLI
ncbi:MAG: ThiF family adenylyltransferase, partial [Candidatus Woesearchaeota archaeon]